MIISHSIYNRYFISVFIMASGLKSWSDLALQYLHQGDEERFVSTLQRVIAEELPKKDYDRPSDIPLKVTILNSLAAYYLHLSTKESDK